MTLICSSFLPFHKEMGDAGELGRLCKNNQQITDADDRVCIRVRYHLFSSPNSEHRDTVFLPELDLSQGSVGDGGFLPYPEAHDIDIRDLAFQVRNRK